MRATSREACGSENLLAGAGETPKKIGFWQWVSLSHHFSNGSFAPACGRQVHLSYSHLTTPAQPFPLSVQYQLITQPAPRGGLQPPLAQRLW